ncbi:MAG: TraB/GumN family protein [Bacilli bacterium]
MKKIKILLSVLLLFTVAIGCGKEPQVKKETREQIDVAWPFYEVQNESGQKMYVLGTIHLGKKEMYPFPETITNALTSSGYLVTEILMESVTTEENVAKMNRAALFKEVGTLDTIINDDTKKHLKSILPSYGMKYNDIISFRPWYVSVLFSNLAFASREADATYGVDNKITDIAEKNNLKLKQLETVDFQIETLLNSYPDYLADDIIQSIMPKKEMEKEVDKLYEAYVNNSIATYMDQSVNPEAEKHMLEIRNKNWLPELEEYIASDEQHFVAVGAGHLEGKWGILTLLKEKGYKVTLVK